MTSGFLGIFSAAARGSSMCWRGRFGRAHFIVRRLEPTHIPSFFLCFQPRRHNIRVRSHPGLSKKLGALANRLRIKAMCKAITRAEGWTGRPPANS